LQDWLASVKLPWLSNLQLYTSA